MTTSIPTPSELIADWWQHIDSLAPSLHRIRTGTFPSHVSTLCGQSWLRFNAKRFVEELNPASTLGQCRSCLKVLLSYQRS